MVNFFVEPYEKETYLMNKFVNKITKKFALLPAEQALLKQDKIINLFRQNFSGNTRLSVNYRMKLLERRILINFMRLFGSKILSSF